MRAATIPLHEFPEAEVGALVEALDSAERLIISTIERECEALRSRRFLAAQALRSRLDDTARLYVNAVKSAKASIATLEMIWPGVSDVLEERRRLFSAVLRIELAALAAERTLAQPEPDRQPAPRAAEAAAARRSGAAEAARPAAETARRTSRSKA